MQIFLFLYDDLYILYFISIAQATKHFLPNNIVSTLQGAGCSCLFNHIRTFVNAKVKWVRDPYLDNAVLKEKDLKQIFFLKNLIISSPSKSLFMSKRFTQFQPGPGLPPVVKLTPQSFYIHQQEMVVHNSPTNRENTV